MTRVVGGIGVPHTPFFPLVIGDGSPLGSEVERLFGVVRRYVDQLMPDVVLLFTSDHLNIFFVESVPIFSVGVAETSRGPSDYPNMPQCEMPITSALARRLQARLVEKGFDVGVSQEFEMDHPITVPITLLFPDLDVPVVPVFVNGLLPPLPNARRCLELGGAIRAALDDETEGKRILSVASGSFSLEIGGPRIPEDAHTGVPDPGWMRHVLNRLRRGEIGQLCEDATREQVTRAGNAGGELLNWLAMLGTVTGGTPTFLEPQSEMGHAYGVWQEVSRT